MIYTEVVTLNGFQYQRVYSDKYYIECEGAQYAEALDPINSGRTYTESTIPLEADAAAADYQAALVEMGVQLND